MHAEIGVIIDSGTMPARPFGGDMLFSHHKFVIVYFFLLIPQTSLTQVATCRLETTEQHSCSQGC